MDVIKTELNELKNFSVKVFKEPKNVAIAVGSVAATYFLYYTVRMYRLRKKYAHIPGPPTNGILGFYMGSLQEVVKEVKSGKVFGELCVQWHEKYGHVFKVQFFNNIMVFTSDRNTIRDVLIVKDYPKIESTIDKVTYPFGERWKHRRAIFNPGFHRHVLMTFVGHFNQITNALTEKFRTMADGKTVVNLFNEINKATLDAIALIAFGMQTDAVTQKDSILNSYLSRILKLVMDSIFDPLMKYKPWKIGEIRDLRKMIRYLRKIGKERIVERINAFKNNEHLPDDILSSILASFKGDNLDLESMTDDFMTFFVAGQETTANALAFSFLELGKNPEIVKKARDEIDRVLGERTDVTYQDFNDLKYCTAIFKEALRMYPPVHMVGRKITEEINVDGCVLPKNTEIFISMFVNGRYDKYFKNPMVFNPDRFMKSAGADSEMENYVYLPFSLGPRNCIGQTFAQLEGTIVIAKLLQKFDLKLDPTQSFNIVQAMTLRPKDGTRCFLTLRS